MKETSSLFSFTTDTTAQKCQRYKCCAGWNPNRAELTDLFYKCRTSKYQTVVVWRESMALQNLQLKSTPTTAETEAGDF